ncbi:ATP-binding cassette domain-containing protein, partial [Mycetocola reblochoni]
GLAALLLLVAVACTLAADLWVAGGRSAARSRLRTRSAARLGEWNPLLLDRRSVGELVRTVVDASERAAAYRAGFFGPIIAAVAAPVVVLLVMALTVSWPVALILAVLIPLVPLIIVGSQRLFRSASAGYRRSAGQLSGAFYESVQGLGELSLAGAAERRGRTLERLGERNRQQVMRLLAGNQMVILAVELAFGLVVTCAAAGLAAAGLAAGWLDTSQAVAVVLLSVLMTGPVSVVGQFFYIGVTGRAAERQLAELWAEPTGNAPAGTTRPRTEQRGRADQPEPGTDARPGTHREAAALEFRDVTAGYPGGPPVLAGFDLRLGRGERLALRGPSGSGKSTVLALAEKLITPRAGSVLIDGVDLATLSRPEVASRMAIVSQSTTLFSGSIADNLRLAAPDADDSRLWDALAAARLADEVRGFEHGLDQP